MPASSSVSLKSRATIRSGALSPTIAIDQKAASRNPRSTVGTITEIYDYLRVLFARIGRQYCIHCGREVGRGDAQGMVRQILALAPQTPHPAPGTHRGKPQGRASRSSGAPAPSGILRGCASTEWCRPSKTCSSLAKHKKHTIEAVVDRLVVKPEPAFASRLTDSVETALKLGQGRLIVHLMERDDLRMSEARSCCGTAYPELQPALFSFNAPQGMCPECNGIGTQLDHGRGQAGARPDTLDSTGRPACPYRNYFVTRTTAKAAPGASVSLRPSNSNWASISTGRGTSCPKSSRR
jgi:excinuclease ABC subunit A